MIVQKYTFLNYKMNYKESFLSFSSLQRSLEEGELVDNPPRARGGHGGAGTAGGDGAAGELAGRRRRAAPPPSGPLGRTERGRDHPGRADPTHRRAAGNFA